MEQAAAEQNVESSALSRRYLVLMYFEQAQRPETTDRKAAYQKAASLIKDALRDESSENYLLLAEINHQLGKDQETRTLLEDRGKANKSDYRAL